MPAVAIVMFIIIIVVLVVSLLTGMYSEKEQKTCFTITGINESQFKGEKGTHSKWSDRLQSICSSKSEAYDLLLHCAEAIEDNGLKYVVLEEVYFNQVNGVVIHKAGNSAEWFQFTERKPGNFYYKKIDTPRDLKNIVGFFE